MSRRRRIGIIGVGFGAKVHVPAFRSEGWDVRAICSRNPDRAAAAAHEADIPGIHVDPFELIQRDDLDAVSIATPPSAHCELSLAALRAGKHVLCEKPFAMDRLQGQQMCAAALEAQRTAMVAHEFRYAPQRAFIKQLLDQCYIGSFQLCTIELFLDRRRTDATPSWARSPGDGGGVLGALGSHYIDAVHQWFGGLNWAAGRLAILRGGGQSSVEAEDTFSCLLGVEGGGLVVMTLSIAVTPARQTRVVVMGDRGTLIAEHPGPNPTDDGIVLGSRDGSAFAALDTPVEFRTTPDARDPRLASFRLLVRDFTRAVEEGRSPSPNFFDGLHCQQILDAIRQSSDSGERIHLHQTDKDTSRAASAPAL